MAARLRFGEDEQAVRHDLEDSTGTLDQPDRDAREVLLELGRQPGGPWLIVSNDAVGDLDVHGVLRRETSLEAES